MTSQSGEFSLSVSFKDAAFSAHGDVTTVLEAYDDFKDLLSMTPHPSDAAAIAVVSPGGSTKDPSSQLAGEPAARTDLPLKPYLSGHSFKGNKEKATAIVAWSGLSGNEPALTHAEIEKLWKKTPFKAPSNLARDIGNAEAEGWLHRNGKVGSPDATFQLTGYGQQILEGWKATGSK
jgi:hypothetical protein